MDIIRGQKSRKGPGFAAILIILVIVIPLAMVGPLMLEYTLESWSDFLGDGNVDVPLWHPGILIVGILLFEILIPVALVTWCLSWVLL